MIRFESAPKSADMLAMVTSLRNYLQNEFPDTEPGKIEVTKRFTGDIDAVVVYAKEIVREGGHAHTLFAQGREIEVALAIGSIIGMLVESSYLTFDDFESILG